MELTTVASEQGYPSLLERVRPKIAFVQRKLQALATGEFFGISAGSDASNRNVQGDFSQILKNGKPIVRE